MSSLGVLVVGSANMDLVASNQYGVAWWENNGDGSDWKIHKTPSGANQVSIIAVGDINGNSNPDIVVGLSVGWELIWWDNGGTFPSLQ